MKCYKCGTEIQEGMDFCYNCGAPLNANQNRRSESVYRAINIAAIVFAIISILFALRRVFYFPRWIFSIIDYGSYVFFAILPGMIKNIFAIIFIVATAGVLALLIGHKKKRQKSLYLMLSIMTILQIVFWLIIGSFKSLIFPILAFVVITILFYLDNVNFLEIFQNLKEEFMMIPGCLKECTGDTYEYITKSTKNRSGNRSS